jgi:hypothetical protein
MTVEVNKVLKKAVIFALVLIFIQGCAANRILDLKDELNAADSISDNDTTGVHDSGSVPSEQKNTQTAISGTTDPNNDTGLEDKLSGISFIRVSDYYVRECEQDGAGYKEMFIPGKDCFVRIGSGESEEEVFSYNYKTDIFTYLYYFSNDLIFKMVYKVAAEEVIEDENDLADLLKTDAELLKEYFNDLMKEANIDINEL